MNNNLKLSNIEQQSTENDSESHKKHLYSKGIYLLPNLFTISALFGGFYAIVAATKGLFDIAAIALFIAMLLDNLDGRVARLTNTQTSLGAELDSLSDMVAFGVAPALIAYHWTLIGLGKIGWLVSFFYVATAALRLARFNSQHDIADKKYFKGLPAPVAAAVIVGFVWNAVEFGVMSNTKEMSLIMAMMTVMTSVLMVSNFRYYSFKELNLTGRVHYLWAVIIVLLLIVIVLEPAKVLFLGCMLYTLSGFLTTLSRKRKLKVNEPS